MASLSRAPKHAWTKDEEATLTYHATKGLMNKLFPYYYELAYVFGRDRVTGRGVEAFADIRSNDPVGYEGFQPLDGNDMEIPHHVQPEL
ncbi:transposase [Cucumis melo var. makuwa]|uniref:Transposase n=1 Tax=Cucumis melo var. makuwa TaxID=1194695 RepID=A0A5A7TIY5_CUCMM|nr:transposase [Cucumis melo var. makuwa]